MMTISQRKTVHHEYRSFLKDRKASASVRYRYVPFFQSSKITKKKKTFRGSRSAEDGSTLFDDALFDGYIEKKKDRRRKHRPIRRKVRDIFIRFLEYQILFE